MTHARTPAPVAGRIGRRWELLLALSLAVVAVSGAVLTYLSVQQGSAAAEADQQALIETIGFVPGHLLAEEQGWCSSTMPVPTPKPMH